MESQLRLTTPSLLDGLGQNDATQWNRFVRIFGPLVQQWLAKFGFVGADADDLIQIVFQSASTNFGQYRHNEVRGGSLRAWLWGITRNKVFDEIRRRNHEPHSEGGTAALLRISQVPDVPFEDSDPQLLNRVNRELAERAIRLIKTDFKEPTWRAFWRTVIDGVPTAEVAEELGMKKNAIRQSRFRVLRHLRNELGTDFFDDVS